MRLAVLILIGLFFFPGLVLGMHPVTDKDLDQVRARAGVDLVIDDFAFYQSFEPQSFVDYDGMDLTGEYPFTGNTRGAKITLGDMGFEKLTVEAISPSGQVGEFQAEFDIEDSDAMDTFDPSAMTIDVSSRLPALTRGLNYGLQVLGKGYNMDVPGIMVGIPTVNLYVQNFYLDDIKVQTIENYDNIEDRKNSVNDGSSFGRINIGSISLAFMDGSAEIASHPFGTGFDLALNDIIIYAGIEDFKYIDWDGSQEMVTQKKYGGPASLEFDEIELDVLRINAITHVGSDGELKSVGKHGLRMYDSGPSMDNYDLNGEDWHAQPFMIDVTSRLPRSTKIHQASGDSGNIAGVYLQQQTMEIYTDERTVDFSIQNEESNPAESVHNNGAHFLQVRDKGVTTDFLSGVVEIAPH